VTIAVRTDENLGNPTSEKIRLSPPLFDQSVSSVGTLSLWRAAFTAAVAAELLLARTSAL
jgi:CRISPR/Cas system endoribonuclease Cas6 (RAMP superfamily)